MKLYQIDAFTDRPFGGNPAAVVPLQQWPRDELLLRIAAENNLSETAFMVANEHGFDLRWFTPEVEMDLCGHATLAAAWVAYHELGFFGDRIRFDSASGPLYVSRRGHQIVLDFPSRPGRPVTDTAPLEKALGLPVREALRARDTLVILDNEQQVRDCQPDFEALRALEDFAVIISAPGDGRRDENGGGEPVDFVSRFFAPRQGVPEDPVTGSAHCTLTPYWAQRLGKDTLKARQLSARGGELTCSLAGNRVHLSGQAVCYLKGEILL